MAVETRSYSRARGGVAGARLAIADHLRWSARPRPLQRRGGFLVRQRLTNPPDWLLAVVPGRDPSLLGPGPVEHEQQDVALERAQAAGRHPLTYSCCVGAVAARAAPAAVGGYRLRWPAGVTAPAGAWGGLGLI